MGCTSSSENGAQAQSNQPKSSPSSAGPSKPSASPAGPPKAKANVPHVFKEHYRMGQQLGSGGYSVAYEATSKFDPSVRVAVKVTQRAGLGREDEDAIRQEIAIMQQLDHPNVVKFFDVFEDDAQFYVVLELLEGGELFDRIVQKTVYNEKEARDLVFIMLSAIKYFHDKNIVHRDLKPENLLMQSKRDDAAVKIADFGFAKKANGSSLATQCGSPGYVAPEILNRMKYGKAVDMWACGVITFILLGGYPPFHDDGHNQSALFDQIRRGAFEFEPEYWGHISADAKDLIRGLIRVDAAKRLTVEQAMAHPWLGKSAAELAAVNLDANLREFKKFNARRKFKAAAKTIMAVNKMSNLINSLGGNNSNHGASEPANLTSNPSFAGSK